MSREPFVIEEIDIPFSPIGLFRLFKDEPYFFFLDSGMEPPSFKKGLLGESFCLGRKEGLGRFSFLGFDPFLVFYSKDNCVFIIEKNRKKKIVGKNPFCILKAIFDRYKFKTESTTSPFIGGGVGYFSYDLCQHLEVLPSRAFDDIGLPDCYIPFYDTVIIFDHLDKRTSIASCGFPELDTCGRIERIKRRLRYIEDKIRNIDISTDTPDDAYSNFFDKVLNIHPQNIKWNFEKEGYISAIKKAKEYIKDGDIYQVNLSQRFSCDLEIPPYVLFERLRLISPTPFLAYLDFNDVKIISASPERFLYKKGRHIHTRPIKGTRPRGKDIFEDRRLIEELLDSPKDRAEHIMIVDLERNDLGRICEYGTVYPTEFITLEVYSTVLHLVSTVSGILRENIDALDCLTNCFPGGSITGAPKIRSMEIIDELEPTKRSVYTGAIGYIGFNQDMDTSIVIRTFILKQKKVYFQVGGGIVADSDPEMEYQETLDKAKALIESLGGQHRGWLPSLVARSGICAPRLL